MSVYEKHTYQDPALPFMFHTDTHSSCDYRGQNWHENIELLSFIHGGGKVRINAKEYDVTVGDIMAINSNCLHEFKTPNSMTYRVLIVDRAFCKANYIDTDNLHFATFFRNGEISECFELLASEYTLPTTNLWRTHTIRMLVIRIMTELCKNHSEQYDESLDENATLMSAVKRAIGYINSNYHVRLSLADICNNVGLSKYYFAREFHRISGYTIVDYINLTRCENAKHLLRNGNLSVLEVAERCGYQDQSYFTRIFKRHTGLSPTAYRNESNDADMRTMDKLCQ